MLDCLVDGRQVLSLKLTEKRTGSSTVNMKLRYVIKRAWFTCLTVSKNTEENSWQEEQRFMYLRLRRLVGSVNEHLLENLHYENELHLQVILDEKRKEGLIFRGTKQFFAYRSAV